MSFLFFGWFGASHVLSDCFQFHIDNHNRDKKHAMLLFIDVQLHISCFMFLCFRMDLSNVISLLHF